ncbi:MAG: universal stress protein [Halococcoides sp.]
MFRRILVATDGSDHAQDAVEYAFQLAERYDATVHAMFAVDTNVTGEPALSSGEVLVSELEDYGSEILDRVEEQAEYRAVDCETSRRHGTPHEAIVEESENVDADIIVLGYRGTSAASAVGSTASRVMRSTDRPVLTV